MCAKIIFHPWVGENYGCDSSVLKKRTLILGGSHYLEGLNSDEDLGDFTNEVVNLYFDRNCKGKWKKTFSTFINSIFGRSTNEDERRVFFESVVFYNYLQEVAGDNPGAAGNYDYGAIQHFEAFKLVLDEYKPEVVISWGDKVWEGLPNDWGFGGNVRGEGVIIDGTVFVKYFDYPYQNRVISLVGVGHPSIGYSRDFHHQIFKALNVV
jgi:hypothetical protein